MGSPSSTRAAPPSPLDLTKAKDYYTKRGSVSSVESTDSIPELQAKTTWSSTKSVSSKRSGHSPKINVYTTCGRHTDQFLFGGRSLADLARAVFGRKPKGE